MRSLQDFQKAHISETTHDFTVIGKTLVNPDFTFREPNEQLCKLFGYTRADLIGMKFTDITPPIIREIDVANAQRVMTGEIPYYVLPKPYKLSKDVRLIYALISVIPVWKNREKTDFECFYVEIMEITKTTYLKLTKELLRSHPALLESQFSWITHVLLFLKQHSLKDLVSLTVKITLMVLAVYITLREYREKGVGSLTELLH